MSDWTARLWDKVDKGGPDGCWVWIGTRTPGGYGKFEARDCPGRTAHRITYELLVGPIPTGLQLDHLCRNRACVNPAHLEPVTNRENILRGESFSAAEARQTHCKRGHPLFGDNLYFWRGRARICRACQTVRNREGKRRRRAALRCALSSPVPQEAE